MSKTSKIQILSRYQKIPNNIQGEEMGRCRAKQETDGQVIGVMGWQLDGKDDKEFQGLCMV